MYKRDAGAYRTDDKFAFNSQVARSYIGNGSPKPLTFVASTVLLGLYVLSIALYIGSFLIPALMLLRSFYTPLLMGVALPAAVIGCLALVLNGSVLLAVLGLVALLAVTLTLAVFSGNHSDEKSYYKNHSYNTYS